MGLEYDENGLAIQDLSKLKGSQYDGEELWTNHPVVIARQATINVGTIGHVAHGKSTVVKSLTGVSTIKYKSEKERNITIKLGYANAKIYKSDDDSVDPKKSYTSSGSGTADIWPCELGGKWQLQRHLSFVDCPGHDILMATMLNGAAVMDAALLLISANETCPQPQTSEHLAAVEIMKLKHIIILQNKVELVKTEAAQEQHETIKEFVAGTVAQDAPIVPISAVLKYNIDVLAQYLCTQIPVPLRDFGADAKMMIIRSFDVNKPGEEIQNLKGGVAGGSILSGILQVGDEIEVRPGVIERNRDGKFTCKPIRSQIINLKSEQNELQFAVPGGLIAVATKMDPTLTRQDRLVGQVLGRPGLLPEVYYEFEMKYHLLKKLLGVKTEDGKSVKIKKLQAGESLMINIGSTATGCKVISVKEGKDKGSEDRAKIEVANPVCTQIGDKLAISRRIEKHFRLIGWGTIMKGQTLDLTLKK